MTERLVCKKTGSNEIIFHSVEKPQSFFKKNNGLMFRDSLAEDKAFMISSFGCQWIHTFFMKFNIDIIYLSKKMRVVKILRNVPPQRLTSPVLGAWSVLECSGNNKNIQKIMTGDIIYVGP